MFAAVTNRQKSVPGFTFQGNFAPLLSFKRALTGPENIDSKIVDPHASPLVTVHPKDRKETDIRK